MNMILNNMIKVYQYYFKNIYVTIFKNIQI